MTHVLVKYSSNWADEMDISGFCLMTKKTYEKWLKGWEDFFTSLDGGDEHRGGGVYRFCIGTNEDIEYYNFKQFISDIDAKEITEDLYEQLEIYFGKCYSFFPEDVPDTEDYS